MVSDFILEKNVDLFCMTETWLSGEPKDNATLAAITPPGYSVKHVPRTGGRGGGVGIIHRDACSLKLIKTSVFKSFEHMTVRVVSGSSQYHIFTILGNITHRANNSEIHLHTPTSRQCSKRCLLV